ncbi:putative inorganic phosphate cotransporter [Brevipalpus obovatus]|uniref:putative inorganic phosphate cotransporter n=1 Tax=Brevipalpus obovatus TaxID=246614 RepID=UPI003D9ED1A0
MAFKIKIRYIITLITFMGFFISFSIKIAVNLTLVALAGGEDVPIKQINSSDLFIESSNFIDIAPRWDHRTRNTVQAAFFYGYSFSQLPSGRISELYGVRYIFGPSILAASLLSVIFPLTVNWGLYAACVLRCVQGILLGVIFPAMNTLMAKWAPQNERSSLNSIIFAGCSFGMIATQALSGYASVWNFFGGWRAIYYFTGLFGLVWFPFWIYFVYDEPSEHPMITAEELATINEGRNKTLSGKAVKLPFKSIFTSIPVYTIILAQIGAWWNVYIVSSQQPEYINAVLDIDIGSNGLLSCLPSIFFMLSSCILALICDTLRSSGYLTITKLRQVFNSIGSFGPALCFFLITIFGKNPVMVNMLFIISMIFSGGCASGSSVSHMDMSPTFAGSLMGITNCLSNFAGFLVPLATSILVGESKNPKDWANLFYLTVAIDIVGGLGFCFFSNSEVQSWDPEYRAGNEKNKLRGNNNIAIDTDKIDNLS